MRHKRVCDMLIVIGRHLNYYLEMFGSWHQHGSEIQAFWIQRFSSLDHFECRDCFFTSIAVPYPLPLPKSYLAFQIPVCGITQIKIMVHSA